MFASANCTYRDQSRFSRLAERWKETAAPTPGPTSCLMAGIRQLGHKLAGQTLLLSPSDRQLRSSESALGHRPSREARLHALGGAQNRSERWRAGSNRIGKTKRIGLAGGLLGRAQSPG